MSRDVRRNVFISFERFLDLADDLANRSLNDGCLDEQEQQMAMMEDPPFIN